MCALKFLGRFKMNAHVNNIFSLRSFVLINVCIRKSDLFVRYFSRKFCGKLVIINIALSINSFIFSLLAKIEHVIMYLFHSSGFVLLWLKISVYTADIIILATGKGNSYLCLFVCLFFIRLSDKTN